MYFNILKFIFKAINWHQGLSRHYEARQNSESYQVDIQLVLKQKLQRFH